MKKTAASIIACALGLNVNCQQSDDGFYQRPSLQAEFGATSYEHNSFIPPDRLRTMTGDMIGTDVILAARQETATQMWLHSPAYFAFHYLHPIKNSRHLEMSCGLLFREQHVGINLREQNTFLPQDTFTHQQNGNILVQGLRLNEIQQYSVMSSQLYLPIGLRVSSDRQLRAWVQAGLELAPGMSVGHQLISVQMANLYEHYSEGVQNSISTNFPDSGYVTTSTANLGGAGFCGYAAVPLRFFVRIAKRENFYGRLNLGVAFTPYYAFYTYRGHSNSRFTSRANVELRCRI